MNKNKGFTLIELLVVIAIIGILSSVVLASLSSARNKGKDAAVKSQLASMRAQAEIYYSIGETYVGICTTAASGNGFGTATGPGLLQAVLASEGVTTTLNPTPQAAGSLAMLTCHELADSWVVDAPLTDSTTPMYCVDSAGNSKAEAVPMLVNAPACL
ncbi:MAG: type II secretion system protein [Candidatus Paceibacterota bacterium]